jgi:hypothetical protein
MRPHILLTPIIACFFEFSFKYNVKVLSSGAKSIIKRPPMSEIRSK